MEKIIIKKMNKYFICLIVILSIFVFDNYYVNAENVKTTQEINICTDEGYGFLVQYDGTSKDMFYDDYGNDTVLTKKLYGKQNQEGSFDYMGTTYKYSYLGVYNKFGNSKNTSRCFKVVEGNQNTNVEVNDDESITTNQKTNLFVSGEWCGEGRIAGSEPFQVKEVRTMDNNTGLQQVIFELSNNDPNANMLNQFWDNVEVTAISYKGTVTSSLGVSKRIVNQKRQIVISNLVPPSYNQEPTLEIAVAVKVDNENKIFTNNITLKNGSYTFGTEQYALDKGEITLVQLKKNCGSTLYVDSIATLIPFDTEIMVNNPYLNNQYCANIKSFAKASLELKKKLAPECYDEKIDLYTKNSGTITEGTIKEKYDRLVGLYDNSDVRLTQLIDVEDLDCTSGFLGIPSSNDKLRIPYETKVTYEEIGTYWAMVCKEEYYIESDIPQLVEAGMGVHYNNKAEVIKTCSIMNINQVQKKPQCSINVSDVNCHYDLCTYCDESMRDVTWTVPGTVGPNDDFDQCVMECDNGLYSQSCINKCYSQVYGSERSLSVDNKISSKTNKIEKFGYKESSNSNNGSSGSCTALITGMQDSNCYSNSEVNVNVECVTNQSCMGKPNCCYVVVNGQRQKEIGVSNYCAGTSPSSISGNMITANHGAGSVCDFSYSVGPSGCSWNPDKDYNDELQKSKNEYDYFYDLASKESEISKYTIEIQDSKSNNIYSINGSTTDSIEDNPNLEIIYEKELSEDSTTKKGNKKEKVIIGSQGDSIDAYRDYTKVTIYSISLPVQYVNKGDYTDIVVRNYETNRYFTFSDKSIQIVNNSKHYKFKEFNEFKAGIYTAGQNVYYTAFDSPQINVSTSTNMSVINEILSIDDYGKAYKIYEINDKKILKELIFEIPNINVYFTFDTVGSENEGKSNVKVNKFTENAGYICYYGIPVVDNDTPPPSTEPPTPPPSTEPPTPPPSTNPPTTPPPIGDPIVPNGLKYYYREIYLEPDNNSYGGVFPNGRNPRWNWTGTIKNGVATGAASNSDASYIVDPEQLIKDIERKGDSIYTNESEYDYVFTLTKDLINEIRRYNDNKKITYVDFSLVAGSTAKKNYSEKIKDWFDNQTLCSQAYSITECNNAIDGKCDN